MDASSFLSADARVMQSSIIRQLTGLVNRPDVISFAAGSPNADTFPHEKLTAIYNDLVEREKGKLFQYSVTRGAPELIEAVRARTAEVKGVTASAEETILVSGSQQGLDFVARVLLDPGDAVFINSAIWHSGSCNQSEGLRRGIYMYYGYWWLKRYQSEFTLPPQCLEGASEARLRLLGYKIPDRDLHIYDPTLPFGLPFG